MVTEFTLQFEAVLERLADIRNFVREKAVLLQTDPSVIPDVLLAVTEVATNIIVHGYQNKDGMIEVEVTKEGYSLVLRLRDKAPLFDPTAVPSPDLTLPLENRPLGGMGVHLTRELMDEVGYRAMQRGGNELTLVKADCIQ